jgi:hypothetical protein
LRELLAMNLERLINDAMLDTAIRRFAFRTLHAVAADRHEKLDEKTKQVLSKDETTVQIGRKKSSWSQLLSGQASTLVQKPPLYYKLFAEVAQTDHGLIENSDGSTEMDQLVKVIENVDAATDPNNAEWQERRAKKEEGAMADGRPPDGKITFKMLADRMIDHVAINLNRDINSGFDTIGVNTTVLKMMTMVLEKFWKVVREAEDAPSVNPKEAAKARAAFVAKQIEISDFGAAGLVLDVISAPVPETLVLQAFKLGIMLLTGGNTHVQRSMWDHLNAKTSDLFFIACRKFLKSQAKKIVDNRNLRAKNIEIDEDTDKFGNHLIEFMRLTAEGHFMPMQEMLREQPNNKKSINLLHEAVEFLVAVARDTTVLRGMDEDELVISDSVVDFLVEMLQGPNAGNQEFLGTTLIVDIGKRIMQAKIFKQGHNNSLTVSTIRSSVCQMFSAMMEGPERPSVKLAIAEKLDLDLFKMFVIELERLCMTLEKTMANKIEDEEIRQDATKENANMLSCGYELFCVYQQLATSDETLEKGIIPPTDKEPDTLIYASAYKYLTSKIKRLEFMWCDPLQMDITYFPLCPQSKALTAPSKDRLMDSVDISTADAKKKDFLVKGQALVDEMFYLYKLQQFPPFFYLQAAYPTIRYGAFGMVIMLNLLLAVTVKGPGNEGRGLVGDDDESPRDLEYEYDEIKIRPMSRNASGVGALQVITVMSYIIIVQYGLCLLYLLVSRVPLILSDRRRKQEDVILEVMKEKGLTKPDPRQVPLGDWSVLGTYFSAVIFYLLFGVVLYIEYGWDKMKDSVEYRRFGWVMFLIYAFVLLNTFFQKAVHPVAFAYCSMFNVLMEQKTLAVIVFLTFMCLGLYMPRFYFLTLPLLDLVTLSERLQNVIKAVVIPIADLVTVFVFMIFVIFIFSAFGMYFFGQQMMTWSDDMAFAGGVGQDGMINGTISFKSDVFTCTNLFNCFTNTLDQGMRSGDISDSSMDAVTYENGLVYADRVLFGLVFFLFLGVILFDIVTGIIIDTFGSLREDTATRIEYLRDTAFISDIERSDYEENGPEFKFEKLEKEDQDRWNYIFYLAHLRLKDPMYYTGAETVIFNKVKQKDTSWFPANKSWALQVMQNKAGGEEDSDDSGALLKMLEDLKTEVQTVKGITQHVFEAASKKK